MDASQLSFFTLGDDGPTRRQELQVDKNGEPLRKRQAHRKSRNGCTRCKQRKVKCDETRPWCLNCRRRGFQCSLKDSTPSRISPRGSNSESSSTFENACELHGTTQERIHTPSDSTWPRSLSPEKWTSDIDENNSDDTPVSVIPGNIHLILRRSPAERELIQHYERFTSKVLALSPTILYLEILNTALRHEYLMSAVMLVAASHINFYLPKNDPSRRPTLHHFANALSGLRIALAEKQTAKTLDTIIGCSILLIHYSWSDINNENDDHFEVAYSFRETVALLHGLKDCIIATQGVFYQTTWSRILLYSPKSTLVEYIASKKPWRSDYMVTINHCVACGVGTRIPKNASSDNISALERLSIPVCAIKLAQPDIEGSGVLYDIYRYLFTWPTFCTKGFLEQVRENNPTSLCILLWYYAAILSVSSEEIWFMRDRSLLMYNTLRARLDGGCDSCTEPPNALYSGDDWPEVRFWPSGQLSLGAMDSKVFL